MSVENYYWLLRYAKRLETFHCSDVKKALEKDEIYFSTKVVLKAIEFWIQEGAIKTLGWSTVEGTNNQVKKYGFVKEAL